MQQDAPTESSMYDPQAGPRVGRRLIYGLIDPRDRCLFYIGKTHKRRELRLNEHIENSNTGTHAYQILIKEIILNGYSPEIFIIRRLSQNLNWREAERAEISFWRNLEQEKFPITVEPQSLKSLQTLVDKVNILNIRDGG